MPPANTKLFNDAIVMLYTAQNDVRTSVNVPNLKNMTASQAANSLKSKNLNIATEGTGKVISQEPEFNASVEEGTVVKIILGE